MHLRLLKVIRKIVEATGDFISSKITNRITKVSRSLIQKQLQMNMIEKYLKKGIYKGI